MLRAAVFVLLASASGRPALASPCDNALKPFRTAWVWSYRTVPADGQAASTYQVQSRAIDRGDTASGDADTGYEDVYSAGGKATNIFRFRCEQGALTIVSLPSVVGIEISQSAVKGVSLPAAPWTPGQSWIQVWTLTGRKGPISGTALVTTQSRVLGRGSVTVPAGTFMAWKLSVKTGVDAKIGFLPMHQDFPEQTQWYAENVGLIRTEDSKGHTELIRLKK
jgi:hypothetical protein